MLKESKLESIELTLICEGITTECQFEGQLLGQAVFTAEDEEYSPQELIQIYQRKVGKFISYMEYSDDKDGIWESKVYLTDELKLETVKIAEIALSQATGRGILCELDKEGNKKPAPQYHRPKPRRGLAVAFSAVGFSS